jgi:transcription elongation factor GreA
MANLPLTVDGAAELRQELERLRSKRPEIMRALAEARAHGDLRENAEYHAARDQQGMVEARIRDIEATLAEATIIDVTKIANQGKVIFGATVHLLNLQDDAEVKYKLVGQDEANIDLGKIAITAPLARLLIGKEVGDVVTVTAVSGKVEYEIIEVEYV